MTVQHGHRVVSCRVLRTAPAEALPHDLFEDDEHPHARHLPWAWGGQSRIAPSLFGYEVSFADLTQDKRRRPASTLVAELEDGDGIAVNDVAAVAGVSRHALRKWRNRESKPARKRMRRLCRLAAFVDYLRANGAEPAEWLSAELDEADGSPSGLRVVDVLAADQFEIARDHFLSRISDHGLLDRVFPGRPTGRGPLHAAWSLDYPKDGSPYHVARVTALDLYGTGETVEEARADLMTEVASYVEEWFSDLHRSEPHRSRVEFVMQAQMALDDGLLGKVLFEE